MTLGSRPEKLTDAVDAILSRSRASASEATGGDSAEEAVRDEAAVLAAAFSELRAEYDEVDAPFVFDLQVSERSRRRVMARVWGVAGATLAAAAAVALVVFLPTASDDTASPLVHLDPVEQESATPVAVRRSSRLPFVRLPGVLDVRTPRLAIVRSVPSPSDDLGGDVRHRPQRAGVSTASFMRLKTARLSTTGAIDRAPSSFPRSPSMIFKPRRKPHDDNADDDVDRGGSSDRKPIGPERLG